MFLRISNSSTYVERISFSSILIGVDLRFKTGPNDTSRAIFAHLPRGIQFPILQGIDPSRDQISTVGPG